MKENRRKHIVGIVSSLCLLLCMGAAFFVMSKHISDLAVLSCFDSLREHNEQFGREISRNMAADAKLLEKTAQLLSNYDRLNSDQARALLTVSSASNMFSRMEILFPDGRLLREDGSYSDAPDTLSYAEEAAKGAHLSSRMADAADAGNQIIHDIVPIVRDGSTEALLCGVIDLGQQRKIYRAIAGDDKSRFYIMEQESGNFLIDTMHKDLGNIHDLASRPLRDGYDAAQVISDMTEGRAGEFAYSSDAAGEYLFCAYGPMDVEGWTAMFSLPESAVLRQAKSIRLMLCLAAALEAVILVSYFVWMLVIMGREAREKSGRLDRIEYMLDIERTLFNSPRNPELMVEALHKIAVMLTAERVFFATSTKLREGQFFIWRKQNLGMPDSEPAENISVLNTRILQSRSILSYNMETLLSEFPEESAQLKRSGVESLMAIPVKDADDVPVGVLGAVNMERRFENTDLLECVMLSFSMALNNMETFQAAEEMSAKDNLTDLNNRNSFQKALEEHEKSGEEALTCVYVDADGLHEINNNYGHAAGDRLLQSVADALKTQFGTEDTFRIGGDEFVAFCRDLSPDIVQKRIRHMSRRIAACGYHVSVGVSRRDEFPLVYEMVKQAEKRMYEVKRQYYENKDDSYQVREMNRELEETLTEKRNLDVFRSVLASKYLGVYILDLSVDSVRSIYIPPYFAEMLEASGGKFSAAIRHYAEECVTDAYHGEFLQLLCYDDLEKRLNRGEEPAIPYLRTDGARLLLKVYRSPDYSNMYRECIWTFEILTEDGPAAGKELPEGREPKDTPLGEQASGNETPEQQHSEKQPSEPDEQKTYIKL